VHDRPSNVSPSSAALAGALAAGPAIAILVLGSTLLGPGLLEVLAEGVTALVPVPAFDAVLGLLGPLAKPALAVAVAAAIPLAGAVLAAGLAAAGLLRPSSPARMALLAAGVALALVELIVLPLTGAGFLGADHRGDVLALQLPIVGAAVAYGSTLAGLLARTSTVPTADEPAPPADPVVGRRPVLGGALGIAALATLAGSGALVLARSVGAIRRPVDPGRTPVDAWGVSPRITPVEDFYVIGKDLVAPDVDLAAWRLTVGGLVARPLELTAADLRDLPRVEGVRSLQCISNEVVRYGRYVGNQRWAGVRVRDVLEAAGPLPEAGWVIWRSADGFSESLPLETALDERTWLVDEMGPPGTLLTRDHGAPLRVLIAGRYGMKQPKWLTAIELAADDEPGYWVRRGWDAEAVVRTYSRIDAPAAGATVVAGEPLAVYGVATAGDRGVTRVEVSPDDGATWREAELEPIAPAAGGELAWRRWRATITLPPGATALLARATDGTGAVQVAEPQLPPLPSGATGLHRVSVVADLG
jgi:DMSO/TMAO reductase YedYZ molybdopterin-dependent catalytic subunit